MDTAMFCYQCEQTSHGTGCIDFGVCGKTSEVAELQDLLVYQLEGLSYFANAIIQKGGLIRPEITWFTIDSLFSTLTNVNFDPKDFIAFLRKAQQFKDALQTQAGALPGKISTGKLPSAAVYRL